jgi:hypothetical protein
MIKYFFIFIIAFLFSKYTYSQGCDSLLIQHRKKGDIYNHDVLKIVNECIDNLSVEISEGNFLAIKNGVEVYKIADGGLAMDMRVILADGLLSNPSAVLFYLRGEQEKLKLVCGIPYIEPTDEFIRHYYAKTNRLLFKLTQSKNEQTKHDAQLCLSKLDGAYKLFLSEKNESSMK